MKIKALILIAAMTFGSAQAQTIEVKDAWVRATVAGQMATGAFMAITAKADTKLVGVSSPAAGITQIHEMKMEDGVMKMRALDGGLDLPAGKPVQFQPGGYHLMLMDLKAPLANNSLIALTLVLRDGKGVESKIELKVPVASGAAQTSAGGKAGIGGHKQ